jgi:hypothetical protein
LDGFAPCSPDGQGQGTVTGLRGLFIEPSRYIVFLSLAGQWGGFNAVDNLSAKPAAFHVDFPGPYKSFVDFVREFQGPVAMTRITHRGGAIRATLSFHTGQAPASIEVTAFCQGGELALVHDFMDLK